LLVDSNIFPAYQPMPYPKEERMRRDRALIVSIAVSVIAWILGRRLRQQSALPHPSAPDYPTSSPASTPPSGNFAQPAVYTPAAALSDLEPIGDTTDVALIPNAEEMIPDEVLVGAPESLGATTGALDPIDLQDVIVMDAPSADDADAITVSRVEDVPGITTTDLVDQTTERAETDQAEVTPAAVGGTDEATGAASPDDLIVIEGIGPKISSIMQAEGITTFAQLVDMDVAQISTMLRSAGITTANPITWPQQAQLARDGQWDALKELQARIKNGRLES
jgi:predicted flap endonuclease-1-like 5' DNA nuclease